MDRQRGFTLLEVLLATALTALVAVMAYAGLSAAVDAAQRHREQVARLGELQSAVGWLVRDLQQLIDRPVRDSRGDELPALLGGEQSDPLLEFSHAGWNNPREQPRGSVQRVRYRLDGDGMLWREHWLVLDRLDDDDQLQSVRLLGGVQRVTLEFLDGKSGNAAGEALGGEWMEIWPVTRGDSLLPLALRIGLELDGIGRVERIVVPASEQNP